MQSKAEDVDQYMREVPPERLQALQRLREMCRSTLVGYEECMVYGGPGYSKNGVVELGFASQKNSINFYILKKEVLDRQRAALKGISVGKGVIRYPRPEKIDFEIVKQLLVDTVNSDVEIC